MVFISTMMTQSKTTYLKLLAVTLFAFFMSACGFHLKGQLPIPVALQTIKLNSLSEMQGFDQTLSKLLKQAGINTLDENTLIDDEIYELKVLKITYTDKVLSKAANNDATEKERVLKASYFIRDAKGKSVYGPRNVSTSRVLSNQNASDDTVLAYNLEQMEEMADDLASQLVSDLAYAPL